MRPEKVIRYRCGECKTMHDGESEADDCCRPPVPDDAPKIGDEIFVGPSDDAFGGRACVGSVRMSMSGGAMVPFVTTQEVPWISYNWKHLREKQAELKERYGDRRASVDG